MSRTITSDEDCADCLCRVCARSVHNDSYNSEIEESDIGCNPCCFCDVNNEVIETDEDYIRYMPDELN